ncbi:MAG TPA: hypothetical protein VF801_13380 [Rhodocyclaceae bacterium]
MAGYHMPRGYASFLSGVSLLVWSIVGLLTVLVSWAIGGAGFKDSIFGDQFMAVFAVGIAFGIYLVYWAQHHGHRSELPDAGDRRHGIGDRRQAA